MLKALDLFCGAGGATKGLQMAGFHVTGVDIKSQPRYCGDCFRIADAMRYPIDGFDFIWPARRARHSRHSKPCATPIKITQNWLSPCASG